MSRIAILSLHSLFAQSLADILARELGAEATVVSEEKSIPESDLVVVTGQVSAVLTKKALRIEEGQPQKIASLIHRVQERLSAPAAGLDLGCGVTLQEKTRILSGNGKTAELTEKEMALLLFVRETGETGRDEILKAVWGVADGVNTQTFETHLYRLRQKWRELADSDCIIATDKGYGWHE